MDGLGGTFTHGDAMVLATAPLLLARDSVPVAVHLCTGAVGEKVVCFGA